MTATERQSKGVIGTLRCMTTSTDIDSRAILTQLTFGVVASRSLHVVAELGVADAIGVDEEADVELIATRVHADPDALHRVLRVLEPHGVFVSHGRLWSHTSASELLRSDHPGSVRPFTRMIGLPVTWDTLTQLEQSVRTGRQAQFLGDAGGLFGYLGAHPDQLSVFDEAMTAKSYADISAILDAVDFSRHGTIADVAGGRGHLLQAILDRHRNVRGVLFELPQVAAEVASSPDGRMKVVAGDFFVGGLPSVELTLLMQVIHDWADADALKILDSVAAAAKPGSTLMLFEVIVAEHAGDDYSKWLDVTMLAVTGGRERTAAEYERLLDQAGYELVRIAPTEGLMSVIEGRRRLDGSQDRHHRTRAPKNR